jgi:hypothetical protein
MLPALRPLLFDVLRHTSIISFSFLWMSASPSPSPAAPNTSAANSNPSLVKSESHLYHPAERRSPTPSLSFIHHTANIAIGSSEDLSPAARPRKKMRRLDSEERRERYIPGRSTSPSNSSQSDRGEPGSDGERNKPSASPTTYEFAEPKKKRTRTLTTPHQAAVLHALLAQVCSNSVHTLIHHSMAVKSRGSRLRPCEKKWESRLA